MAAQAFANKHVVITGGSRGIGLGLVKLFLQQPGCTVNATTRQPASAAHLLELQKTAEERLQVTALDTSSSVSVKSWAASLACVPKHIDVLVNSAGIYGRRLPLAELEEEDFLAAYQVNAIGPFLVVQQLRAAGLIGQPPPPPPPQQQQQPPATPPRSTLVVNISSIVASHGDQTTSSTLGSGYAYRASKAALNIITKVLCIDCAQEGLECVLLHPGYVRTELTGGLGAVDVDDSAAGMMQVLSSGKPLNGRFYSFTGDEIPW